MAFRRRRPPRDPAAPPAVPAATAAPGQPPEVPPAPEPAAVHDDDHLMAAARDGDLDAFNLLVLRHERAVFNVCLRLLRDVQAAEDAAQDAFLRAWSNARAFQGGSVRAWLLRIATNRSYDLLRVRARRPAAALEAEAVEIEPVWSTQSAVESPEAGALRNELGIYLERALAALPEDQRTVVLLSDIQGCSYEEAAAATGAAVGTVKSRLSRGRAKLRQALTDDPTAAELFARYRRCQSGAMDAPAADGRDGDDG